MIIQDQFRRRWTSIADTNTHSGGSPGDRASARFPSEPPSLARPTPQGRATVAQRGGASPWWARALEALERAAPWMFEPIPADQLHLYVRDYRSADSPSPHRLHGNTKSQVTEQRASAVTSVAPTVGIESAHHAPASCLVSV